MFQIPPILRRALLETGKIQNPRVKAILTEEDLTKAAEMTDKLAFQAVKDNPNLAAAWALVAPLLKENPAVSQVLMKHPEAAQVMPEILTVDEAVLIAQQEYWLSESESNQLSQVLSQPLPE